MTSCPICSNTITGSLQEISEHVNRCIDSISHKKSLQKDISFSSTSKKNAQFAQRSLRDFYCNNNTHVEPEKFTFCPLCTKNISRMSQALREKHFVKCLTKFNADGTISDSLLSTDIAKLRSCIVCKQPWSAILNDFKAEAQSKLTNLDFLRNKTLHMSQCAELSKIDLRKLLNLILESIENCNIEENTDFSYEDLSPNNINIDINPILMDTKYARVLENEPKKLKPVSSPNESLHLSNNFEFAENRTLKSSEFHPAIPKNNFFNSIKKKSLQGKNNSICSDKPSFKNINLTPTALTTGPKKLDLSLLLTDESEIDNKPFNPDNTGDFSMTASTSNKNYKKSTTNPTQKGSKLTKNQQSYLDDFDYDYQTGLALSASLSHTESNLIGSGDTAISNTTSYINSIPDILGKLPKNKTNSRRFNSTEQSLLTFNTLSPNISMSNFEKKSIIKKKSANKLPISTKVLPTADAKEYLLQRSIALQNLDQEDDFLLNQMHNKLQDSESLNLHNLSSNYNSNRNENNSFDLNYSDDKDENFQYRKVKIPGPFNETIEAKEINDNDFSTKNTDKRQAANSSYIDSLIKGVSQLDINLDSKRSLHKVPSQDQMQTPSYSHYSVRNPSDLANFDLFSQKLEDMQKKYSNILCTILDDYVAKKNNLANQILESYKLSKQKTLLNPTFSETNNPSFTLNSLKDTESTINPKHCSENLSNNFELEKILDYDSKTNYISKIKKDPLHNRVDCTRNDFLHKSKLMYAGNDNKTHDIILPADINPISLNYNDDTRVIELSSSDEQSLDDHRLSKKINQHKIINNNVPRLNLNNTQNKEYSIEIPSYQENFQFEKLSLHANNYNTDSSKFYDLNTCKNLYETTNCNKNTKKMYDNKGGEKKNSLETIIKEFEYTFKDDSSLDSFEISENSSQHSSPTKINRNIGNNIQRRPVKNNKKKDNDLILNESFELNKNILRNTDHSLDQKTNRISSNTSVQKVSVNQKKISSYTLDNNITLCSKKLNILQKLKPKAIPDYTKMTFEQIKIEAKKYGLKTNTSKKLLLLQLNEITTKLNSPSGVETNDPNAANEAINSVGMLRETSTSSVSSELFIKKNKNDAELYSILLKLISEDEEIYSKVVLYRPIDFNFLLEKIHSWQIKCSKPVLQAFLDSQVRNMIRF
ncbi:hypothetical protein BB561_006283 [Smittium simulii]|uniref:SAP domain-containing protein n=1 Tax=Smittium simulii TaxID=133385 RepID=A0A2T9Y5F3_9FUNG|nr:hypothetical protein BB561_006283 [Smittium simulii]